MAQIHRTYKKLVAALTRAEAYAEALEDLGIDMGPTVKHSRNARKAALKAGEKEFPTEETNA